MLPLTERRGEGVRVSGERETRKKDWEDEMKETKSMKVREER